MTALMPLRTKPVSTGAPQPNQELEKGRRGQFDIVVDDRPVVSRKGGLLAKLLGRPWPTAEHVLTAVREAMEEAAR